MLTIRRCSIFALLFLQVSGVLGSDVKGKKGGSDPAPDPCPNGCECGYCVKYCSDSWEATNCRRFLESETAFRGDEEEILELAGACGAYDYEVLLYVTTHVTAVAIPKEEARQAGCPLVTVDARFEGKGTVAQKEVHIYMDKEDEDALREDDEDLLPLGTYNAAELVHAFQVAEDPSGFGPYNLMSNNCADFIIELGKILNVKIDYRVTSWAARRLLKHSGEQFASQIRSSADYFYSFFSGRKLAAEELADEELVELLVETRASKLYN